MIERYKDSTISNLWNNIMTTYIYIEFEIANQIIKKCNKNIDIIEPSDDNIDKILRLQKKYESECNHDLAALVKAIVDITNTINPEYSKLIHKNLTSSDIKDSALSLIMYESNYHILYLLNRLRLKIDELSNKYKNILVPGMTHGQIANTIDLSDRFKLYSYIVSDRISFVEYASSRLATKANGPVGNNPSIIKSIFGIPTIDIKMQIIPRSIYSDTIYAISSMMEVINKISEDLRLMCMQEIGIFKIKRNDKYIGSSSMPHKNNPSELERICGLARLSRSYMTTALSNISSWLERDLCNSASERIYIEDMYHIASFSLKSLYIVLNKLYLNEKNISHLNKKYKRVLKSNFYKELSIENGKSIDSIYKSYREII